MTLTRYTPPAQATELTEEHTRRLQNFLTNGYEFQLFELFPGFVGVKKYGCAALLRPMPDGTFSAGAQAGYLIEGNISVKIEQGGEEWFVWKQHREAATPERKKQLSKFEKELASLLEA